MELSVIKELIKKRVPQHNTYINTANQAELYYINENDIERDNKKKIEENNPLRNADNRVSHNFYSIIVDQTAGYMFTYPPTFDVKNKDINKRITEVLGDHYSKTCKDLSVNASNASTAWLHVWKDKNNKFKYATVDGKQIIPIYSDALDKELIAVLRVYSSTNDIGEKIDVYEYWNDKECVTYSKKANDDIEKISEYAMFTIIDVDTNSTTPTNIIKHDWGEVPFICFSNNNKCQNDLKNVKKLIDVYDKVLSGYINDIEDIQQVIFILEGYGGTDLNEFLGDLKRYKTVNTQNDASSKSDVRTLSIDIPVEARNKLSEIIEKNIYKLGQAVDISADKIGNAKGVVIDHLYGFLELKAGLKQTEFEIGFGRLIRFILKYLNQNTEMQITQTWQRNKVRDDLELAQIISYLAAHTSKTNIAKANPLVEDWQEELKLQEQDIENESKNYMDNIPKVGFNNG